MVTNHGDELGDAWLAETLFFNGVSAHSGGYEFPQMSAKELTDLFSARVGTQFERDALQLRGAVEAEEAEDTLVIAYPPNSAERLQRAGWALIAADDADPEVMDALTPLRAQRAEQAGDRYREFVGSDGGIKLGETAQNFLLRERVDVHDVADPRKLPYYALIVGSPERIPYEFQYSLGVQRAVGRLDFDEPADYAAYANKVVRFEAENGQPGPPRVQLFGTQNPGDRATALSSRFLVQPLLSSLAESELAITVESCVGTSATKRRLYDAVCTTSSDVLFTATHGLCAEGASQRDLQGALLCQEWRAPSGGTEKAVLPDEYFSAHDLPSDVFLGPTVMFSFACFSAGTPHRTDFAEHPLPGADAPAPFTSRLSQRMLAHPQSRCVGFIGHVDRVWGTSFLWKGIEPQILPFDNVVAAFVDGQPLGMALEYLKSRRTSINYELTEKLKLAHQWGLKVDSGELAQLWLASHDARNFLLCGDPAVKSVCKHSSQPA